MRITPKPGFVGKSNKLTRPGAGKVPRRKKGADMTAEDYRAELELQYSVTELEAVQESGG